MQWTQAVPLTNGAGADGEVVWSWTPSAGVDGGYQAWYAGESTKETVTPLRGECRVSFGVTVVTMLVCFVFQNCMRGCGRIKRPAFPAPSD